MRQGKKSLEMFFYKLTPPRLHLERSVRRGDLYLAPLSDRPSGLFRIKWNYLLLSHQRKVADAAGDLRGENVGCVELTAASSCFLQLELSERGNWCHNQKAK